MQQVSPSNKFDVFARTLTKDAAKDSDYGTYPYYKILKEVATKPIKKTKRNQHFTKKV